MTTALELNVVAYEIAEQMKRDEYRDDFANQIGDDSDSDADGNSIILRPTIISSRTFYDSEQIDDSSDDNDKYTDTKTVIESSDKTTSDEEERDVFVDAEEVTSQENLRPSIHSLESETCVLLTDLETYESAHDFLETCPERRDKDIVLSLEGYFENDQNVPASEMTRKMEQDNRKNCQTPSSNQHEVNDTIVHDMQDNVRVLVNQDCLNSDTNGLGNPHIVDLEEENGEIVYYDSYAVFSPYEGSTYTQSSTCIPYHTGTAFHYQSCITSPSTLGNGTDEDATTYLASHKTQNVNDYVAATQDYGSESPKFKEIDNDLNIDETGHLPENHPDSVQLSWAESVSNDPNCSRISPDGNVYQPDAAEDCHTRCDESDGKSDVRRVFSSSEIQEPNFPPLTELTCKQITGQSGDYQNAETERNSEIASSDAFLFASGQSQEGSSGKAEKNFSQPNPEKSSDSVDPVTSTVYQNSSLNPECEPFVPKRDLNTPNTNISDSDNICAADNSDPWGIRYGQYPDPYNRVPYQQNIGPFQCQPQMLQARHMPASNGYYQQTAPMVPYYPSYNPLPTPCMRNPYSFHQSRFVFNPRNNLGFTSSPYQQTYNNFYINDQMNNCNHMPASVVQTSPTPGFQYPAVYLSEAGLITVLLRRDFSVEMTVDQVLRVVNHKRKLVVSIDSQGTETYVFHPAARIIQDGDSMEVEVFLQRKVKMTPTCVVFANNFKCYKFDKDDIEEAQPEFADLGKDRSVDYLFASQSYTAENSQKAACIAAEAKIEHQEDGVSIVHINGVDIVQNERCEVTVTCGPKVIRMFPNNSSLQLKTDVVDVSIGINWCVKLRKGSYVLNASHCGFIVSNGRIEAGFDDTNKPFACLLPRRAPILSEHRKPRRRNRDTYQHSDPSDRRY